MFGGAVGGTDVLSTEREVKKVDETLLADEMGSRGEEGGEKSPGKEKLENRGHDLG